VIGKGLLNQPVLAVDVGDHPVFAPLLGAHGSGLPMPY